MASSEEGSYYISYHIEPARFQALTIARQFLAIVEPRTVFQPGVAVPPIRIPNRRIEVVVPDLGQRINVQQFRRTLMRTARPRRQMTSGSWSNFTAAWQSLSEQGLRLTRIASFRIDEGTFSFGDTRERHFSGSFEPGTDGYALWVCPRNAFAAKMQEFAGNGLRLVDLACHRDGDTVMFSGVFRSGSDTQELVVEPWPAFESRWQALSQAGMRMVAIDTFMENGARKFIGVYRAGNDGHGLWVGADIAALKAKAAEFSSQGIELLDLAGYTEGQETRFAAIFRTSPVKRELIDGRYEALQEKLRTPVNLVSFDTYLPGDES
jgi:hypothetical protein